MSGFVLPGEFRRHAQCTYFKRHAFPFFSVCSRVDVSRIREESKKTGAPSFSMTAIFLALKAANSIEEFRLRLRENGVWLHDEIHASSTILLEDGSLAFSFFRNSEDLAEFLSQAQDALRHQTEHPSLTEWDDRDDVLFFTSLPWIEFTSFTNPQRSALDSIPKIAFGKYFVDAGVWWMPVSVEVHHALVDGIHVSRFLESFQRNLNHSC